MAIEHGSFQRRGGHDASASTIFQLSGLDGNFSLAQEEFNVQSSIESLLLCKGTVPILVSAGEQEDIEMTYGVAIPVESGRDREEIIILRDALFSVVPKSSAAVDLAIYSQAFGEGDILVRMEERDFIIPERRVEKIKLGFGDIATIKEPGVTLDSRARILATYKGELPRLRSPWG